MNIKIEKLFDDGELDFNVSGGGEKWVFTATGDYGILPSIAENIKCNGIKSLATRINELIKADVSMTNLEIGLTSATKVADKGVRGDRELFMRMHYAAPFSIYSLANNHVRDAGIDELRKTCKEFKANDILYVGGGIDKSEAEKPLFLNCKGVKIGILAFAQKENQIATENDPGAAELITDKVLVATERLVSQCDVPIVVMHEGYEFMDFPRVPFMELCRKLTTLGIKIVIGHHSHVPQGMEYINNAFIFYSLGNFLFDQPHFKSYPWSRRSFVPAIHFEGTQIRTVELRPFKIELNPLDIQPADPDERVTMLVHLKKITELIDSETKFREATNHFYTNILLPEFLGFIRNYGNQYNNDFSALIEQFKGQKPVHNVFADFLTVYGKD